MDQQKTVLLTGATGFLGSHILEALLVKGHKVAILKRTTSDTWRINHLLKKVISYDVNVQSLELAFEEQHVDAVMHTACHYGRNGDLAHQIVESNLMFGLRLLDASLKFNVDTFINTDTLLRKELNLYTLSKKQFVEWLKQQSKKIKVINLKVEHMYGINDDTTKFVPWVIAQLKDKIAEINLTKGEQKRDFIYVDDVVSAFLTTLEKSPDLMGFNEFDVGTGRLVSIKVFLQSLMKIFEAKFGESTTKLVFGAVPYREGEMMTVEVNNQSLLELGWKPKTKLEDGLQYIIGEYR